MSKEHVGLLTLGIVVLLWATSVAALSPQTIWTRTYGDSADEFGESVQQTSDGGYIITGCTTSFGAGGGDVYLIKTDARGDTVWTRTYGGAGGEAGRSVRQTTDAGYIIAGETDSFGAGNNDVYLIKTDSSGDTIWTRAYGGTEWDVPLSVQQTTDGGYIAVGETGSFGAGSWDVYLLKTDASGDTAWTRTYGGTGIDHGCSVQQTTDDGYIIAGYADSFGAGDYDVYLIKTDANGDTVWTRRYGGMHGDRGHSVHQTADGGYVVAGATASFGAGSYDVYLVRTDANGDTVWTRTYGGTDVDSGRSVRQTSDGGYIIAGETLSFGAGAYDAYLIRTDTNGDMVWTEIYGGTGGERWEEIQEISDGRYIVVGSTTSFGAGVRDIYLIKVREHNLKAKDMKFGESPAPGPRNREPVVALSGTVPARLALHGSAPNPFSEATLIRFELAEQGKVKLSIHDIQGRLVRELVGETRPPGSYSAIWDGRNSSDAEVPAGIYFVHLESGGKVATGKVVVAH